MHKFIIVVIWMRLEGMNRCIVSRLLDQFLVARIDPEPCACLQLECACLSRSRAALAWFSTERGETVVQRSSLYSRDTSCILWDAQRTKDFFSVSNYLSKFDIHVFMCTGKKDGMRRKRKRHHPLDIGPYTLHFVCGYYIVFLSKFTWLGLICTVTKHWNITSTRNLQKLCARHSNCFVVLSSWSDENVESLFAENVFQMINCILDVSVCDMFE